MLSLAGLNRLRVATRANTLVTLTSRSISSKLSETGPSPPKLPKKDQVEFEALQKIASSQAAIDEYNRQINAEEYSSEPSPVVDATDVGTYAQYLKTIPEFEGDVNPKTGEMGGPKQDPLKHNDWSFNGRVTDF
ncbi:hypothetical protein METBISCDRAFT_21005 [Metschnikowia bicuspidata]|uniref:Succinate dehydrogenase assembly factor 4, mitochondrial n=1 Tax=Metschnikowia bicuspidata TaxID=27322 RepID=A0A4P9ZHU2_9ASCO|nr:hypothetical protein METBISCDRAFT_21005 [Metschnikowia bicuspidata]